MVFQFWRIIMEVRFGTADSQFNIPELPGLSPAHSHSWSVCIRRRMQFVFEADHFLAPLSSFCRWGCMPDRHASTLGGGSFLSIQEAQERERFS